MLNKFLEKTIKINSFDKENNIFKSNYIDYLIFFNDNLEYSVEEYQKFINDSQNLLLNLINNNGIIES